MSEPLNLYTKNNDARIPSKSSSHRVQRVEKEIREIVSKFIITKVPEAKGIVGVSRVIVSRDLRKAKILIHNLEGLKQTKENVETFKSYSHLIQKEIGSQIRMRYCPKIEFYVDEKYDDVLKVQNMLHQLELERQQKNE